ncbi:MAG: 4-hydroxy-tetrahydrodipicolinate synthase [Bacteroidia bacterium]|nr:4-hydroxy-tetrahydrodipicolinate synthase [Bacteroidia bacterium]
MLKFLNGTGVALVTPFTQSGQVDLNGLANLVEHVIGGGVEYLVVLGTTGETATLTAAEKEVVVSKVIEVNNSRVPVVLGIGGNNTAEVLNQLEEYNLNEISAILSVSPYYNKPSQEGIFQHYKAISQASPKPVIIYNVPGRTASNISAETTLRIARELPNVVATKEASGSLEQIMQIINHKPEGFRVISGDDNLTLPIIAAGGSGVISVVANSFPAKFSEMVRFSLKGDFASARKLHYALLDLMGLHFAEGNPVGVKAILHELGVCGSHVRLPLVHASEGLKAKIRETIHHH